MKAGRSTLAPYIETKQIVVMGEPEVPLSVDWELARRPKPILTLQLHQPDGAPLADTQVFMKFDCVFSSREQKQLRATHRARTDPQGHLKFPLYRGAGTYSVTLRVKGYREEPLENILLFDDSPGPEFEITLQE